jgi:hypothetical protein
VEGALCRVGRSRPGASAGRKAAKDSCAGFYYLTSLGCGFCKEFFADVMLPPDPMGRGTEKTFECRVEEHESQPSAGDLFLMSNPQARRGMNSQIENAQAAVEGRAFLPFWAPTDSASVSGRVAVTHVPEPSLSTLRWPPSSRTRCFMPPKPTPTPAAVSRKL